MRNSEFFCSGWLKILLCGGFERTKRIEFCKDLRIKTTETGFLGFLRFVTSILRKTRFLTPWVSPSGKTRKDFGKYV